MPHAPEMEGSYFFGHVMISEGGRWVGRSMKALREYFAGKL